MTALTTNDNNFVVNKDGKEESEEHTEGRSKSFFDYFITRDSASSNGHNPNGSTFQPRRGEECL